MESILKATTLMYTKSSSQKTKIVVIFWTHLADIQQNLNKKMRKIICFYFLGNFFPEYLLKLKKLSVNIFKYFYLCNLPKK